MEYCLAIDRTFDRHVVSGVLNSQVVTFVVRFSGAPEDDTPWPEDEKTASEHKDTGKRAVEREEVHRVRVAPAILGNFGFQCASFLSELFTAGETRASLLFDRISYIVLNARVVKGKRKFTTYTRSVHKDSELDEAVPGSCQGKFQIGIGPNPGAHQIEDALDPKVCRDERFFRCVLQTAHLLFDILVAYEQRFGTFLLHESPIVATHLPEDSKITVFLQRCGRRREDANGEKALMYSQGTDVQEFLSTHGTTYNQEVRLRREEELD